jgi:hypothetical protein
MNLPKLPVETTPFLWVAASGAIALSIVGFTWGGWMSAGGAERMAGARAEAATVAALAPICVTQFRAGAKAKANLAELKAANSWDQAEYVRNGGWATMPGAKDEPSREIAAACAEALTAEPVTKVSP